MNKFVTRKFASMKDAEIFCDNWDVNHMGVIPTKVDGNFVVEVYSIYEYPMPDAKPQYIKDCI